jgi:hypothetical protein
MAKGDPSAGVGMCFLTDPVKLRDYIPLFAGVLAQSLIAGPLMRLIWEKTEDAFAIAVRFLVGFSVIVLAQTVFRLYGRIRWKSRSRRVLGWPRRSEAFPEIIEAACVACVFVAGANFAASRIEIGSIPWWAPTAAGFAMMVPYLLWAIPRSKRRHAAWRDERARWLESIGKA